MRAAVARAFVLMGFDCVCVPVAYVETPLRNIFILTICRYSSNIFSPTLHAWQRIEVFAISVGATRSRTNRVMRKKGRIQACVHRLFLASPGVASNGGV